MININPQTILQLPYRLAHIHMHLHLRRIKVSISPILSPTQRI